MFNLYKLSKNAYLDIGSAENLKDNKNKCRIIYDLHSPNVVCYYL